MAREGCACRLRGGEHVAGVIDLVDQADTRDIELLKLTRAATIGEESERQLRV
jgi:hypothetical protein